MRSNNLFPLLLSAFLITAGCSAGHTSSTTSQEVLVSITVTPTNPSIAPGTVQQFTATGTYSNNTRRDVTTSASWSSSSTGIATISNTTGFIGQVSSLAHGTTTITASVGNISGSTTLTVTTATLSSLSVMPVNPSVTAGSTEQFSATGTFSDSTMQVVTSVVTWGSSSTPVATISNTPGSNGLASAVSMGSSTITALSGSTSNSTTLTVTAAVNNVVPITVDGSLCSSSTRYLNKPCVSVTVCQPGTSTCQVITDLLLDTGSYGLRIFSQALTAVTPVQVNAAVGGSLTECVKYADGSSQWGPVKRADIVLGGETAPNVPIQIIDSTFGTPTSCGIPQTSPSTAGFNGILGVGLFQEDCGTGCQSTTNNFHYYGCSGSSCSPTIADLADQVQNPVASLPMDNNGVIVQLPGVSLGGTTSVTGKLILGIGTESNNTPSGVKMYQADPSGNITTQFNGSTLTSFLDSGSNGLFFPSGAVPACASPNSAWYCPSSTTTLSATNTGGSSSGTVTFQIGNFINLANSSNSVFVEIGGSFPGYFDWGLPFYFGRSVYVGINGKTSSLGTGPYWAY